MLLRSATPLFKKSSTFSSSRYFASSNSQGSGGRAWKAFNGYNSQGGPGSNEATSTGTPSYGTSNQINDVTANNQNQSGNPSDIRYVSAKKAGFGNPAKRDGGLETTGTESSNLNKASIPIPDLKSGPPKTDPLGQHKVEPRPDTGSISAQGHEGEQGISAEGQEGETEYEYGDFDLQPFDINNAGDVHDLEEAREGLGQDYYSVESRYAYSLWMLYKKAGQLDYLGTDVVQFYEAVYARTKRMIILSGNDLITENAKSRALEKLIREERMNPLFSGFLRTVAQQRRLGDLDNILNELVEVEARIVHGKRSAIVNSAQPLSETEMQSIRTMLKNTFKPKGDIEIVERIKPEVLGGYEVFYDGVYHMDNTRAGAIRQLENELLDAQAARGQDDDHSQEPIGAN